jgi:hypothetical protein
MDGEKSQLPMSQLGLKTSVSKPAPVAPFVSITSFPVFARFFIRATPTGGDKANWSGNYQSGLQKSRIL